MSVWEAYSKEKDRNGKIAGRMREGHMKSYFFPQLAPCVFEDIS